jgi:thioredoxin
MKPRVQSFLMFLVAVFLFLTMALQSSLPELSFGKSPVPTVEVITVNEDNFKAEVLKSKVPVLVDFFAVWCGPCRMYSPMLDKLAQKYAGRLKVVRVDVDKSPGLYAATHSQVVPTTYVFKKGKAVDQWRGVPPEEDLEKELAQFLSKPAKSANLIKE